MNHIKCFIKKEIVLVISMVLAVLSMLFVPPDAEYLGYIDFRTLAILFCMMTIVAGLRKLGLFELLAGRLLGAVHGMPMISMILVGLCFFLSMLITNDVALITFVPFTIVTLKQMGEDMENKHLVRIVVMQTIAANLGSMLTPIGNPQNLYLFGKSNMSFPEFFGLMLPYSLVALLLLVCWIWIPVLIEKMRSSRQNGGCQSNPAGRGEVSPETVSGIRAPAWRLLMYLLLFVLSLLGVARILPVAVVFLIVLGFAVVADRGVVRAVDYSLLGTFVALFIFIGNLGRQQAFSDFLHYMIDGREVFTAIAASQVMSNVPAAILLSGFTDNTRALIVGTNLGGLGTLIASMASLISFKYIVREDGELKGHFFRLFTVANIAFLAVLAVMSVLLGI